MAQRVMLKLLLKVEFNVLLSESMIVCLCKGVSSHTVRDVIEDGADSVEAVGSACGAGTDCGGCTGQIEDMVEEVHGSEGCRRHLRVVAA